MDIENIIKELNPTNHFTEKNKITLLFGGDRMLMISKLEDKFVYSYFINRMHIASDIRDINEFITEFKKYLENTR